VPLIKAGVPLVGIDRSAEMIERARVKFGGSASRQLPKRPTRQVANSAGLVRGDIRRLPFNRRTFDTVIAPYGVLQSLLVDRDLSAALNSVARVLRPGGTFGLDLVPDVPNWREYSNRVQLKGPAARGVHLTLVESVRQDRVRRLTTFEQRYIERRAGRSREHAFELVFRTLSVRQMTSRLDRAGFVVDRVLGDYRGRPWDERADVWILLAKKR
jgi:ubiquinone/menaquinone biosynthesis C-methylase UbiE